jgi:BolA protein
MKISELIKIIEKKILSQDCITKVKIEDKSFLHKNHRSNEEGKFHILLLIESAELKEKNKLYSTRFIYKLLDNELKKNIHSLQIKLI